MKKLLNGDSGTRSVTFEPGSDDKVAIVQHCWKRDKDAPRYQLEFTYNLDIDEREIYRLAVLWINKDFQNRLRAEKATEKQLEDLEKSPISVFDVYAKRERAARDPKKAAQNALSKLSKEEIAELLSKFA